VYVRAERRADAALYAVTSSALIRVRVPQSNGVELGWINGLYELLIAERVARPGGQCVRRCRHNHRTTKSKNQCRLFTALPPSQIREMRRTQWAKASKLGAATRGGGRRCYGFIGLRSNGCRRHRNSKSRQRLRPSVAPWCERSTGQPSGEPQKLSTFRNSELAHNVRSQSTIRCGSVQDFSHDRICKKAQSTLGENWACFSKNRAGLEAWRKS
jgi:hypothetical protein